VLAVPETRHTVSGRTVDAGDEPGTATGRVVGSAHQRTERPGGTVTDLLRWVRYRDSYRYDEGSWRFSRREPSVDWVEVRQVRHWLRD
jgi:hypothetical protein